MIKLRFLLGALAALVLLVSAQPSAQAADLVTVDGSPALRYEFGAFTRRGVTIGAGGTFVVRFDGCWTADMTVENPVDAPALISIVLRFATPSGAPYTDVVLASGVTVEPAGIAEIESEGCNPRLEAAFPVLQSYPVRRVYSVR